MKVMIGPDKAIIYYKVLIPNIEQFFEDIGKQLYIEFFDKQVAKPSGYVIYKLLDLSRTPNKNLLKKLNSNLKKYRQNKQNKELLVICAAFDYSPSYKIKYYNPTDIYIPWLPQIYFVSETNFSNYIIQPNDLSYYGETTSKDLKYYSDCPFLNKLSKYEYFD